MTAGVRALSAVTTLLALNGCYRTTEIEPHQIHRVRAHGDDGIAVEYRSGTIRYYDNVDRLEVQTQKPRPVRRNSGAPTEFTRVRLRRVVDRFETPLYAQVTESSVNVYDSERRESYPIASVERMRAQRFAPDRVPIMFATALGSAIVAGAVTWFAISGNCDPDRDFGCMGPWLISLGVGSAAAIGGFVVAIPLTADMNPDAETTPELRSRFPTIEYEVR